MPISTGGLPEDKELFGMGKTDQQTFNEREDMARFKAGDRRDPCHAARLTINCRQEMREKFI